VTECMETTVRDSERVENRPQLALHDLVGGRRPPIPSGKQKPLRIGFPFLPIFTQDGCELVGHRNRRSAPLALCGLNFSVPRRAAEMNAFMVEVYVWPLKAQSFTCTQSCKGEKNKKRPPRLLCKPENVLDL